jgi:uncharacterized protein YcsI (UPF0317 family)
VAQIGKASNSKLKTQNSKRFLPSAVRALIRAGTWTGNTAGLAAGYAQANLVIIPKKLAFDFLLFCQRNPKPCPVLEVMEPGVWTTGITADGADIRTDLPAYNVYERGRLTATVGDITSLWRNDLVSFLLGCSYSFEEALVRARVPVRHMEEGKNVPMYITNMACMPAGAFKGPVVVSMRPVPHRLVARAVQVTARYPRVHGAPVHIGDPAAIGIRDLASPDFGDAVSVRPGETPVFWACGVTPQAVAMEVKPPLCITHAPGHMFITDVLNEELADP